MPFCCQDLQVRDGYDLFQNVIIQSQVKTFRNSMRCVRSRHEKR